MTPAQQQQRRRSDSEPALIFYRAGRSAQPHVQISVYNDTPSPPDKPRHDDDASLIQTVEEQILIQLSSIKYWQVAAAGDEDVDLVHLPNVFLGISPMTRRWLAAPWRVARSLAHPSIASSLSTEFYVSAA